MNNIRWYVWFSVDLGVLDFNCNRNSVKGEKVIGSFSYKRRFYEENGIGGEYWRRDRMWGKGGRLFILILSNIILLIFCDVLIFDCCKVEYILKNIFLIIGLLFF